MNRQPPAMMPDTTSDDYGPAAGLASLCEEIDQLFNDLALPGRLTFVHPSSAGTMPAPPAGLIEQTDHYELAIELPGLERKDITVEFAGGVLSVAGEKRAQSEEQSGECLISERRYGAFRRRFNLPQDVDPDRIEACYQHGVLKVSVGKDAAAQGRVRTIAVT